MPRGQQVPDDISMKCVMMTHSIVSVYNFSLYIDKSLKLHYYLFYDINITSVRVRLDWESLSKVSGLNLVNGEKNCFIGKKNPIKSGQLSLCQRLIIVKTNRYFAIFTMVTKKKLFYYIKERICCHTHSLILPPPSQNTL